VRLWGLSTMVLCLVQPGSQPTPPPPPPPPRSYGQPAGLVYSYPCTCEAGGSWKIVQGLEIDARSAEKLRITAEELTEERELALECIKEAAA